MKTLFLSFFCLLFSLGFSQSQDFKTRYELHSGNMILDSYASSFCFPNNSCGSSKAALLMVGNEPSSHDYFLTALDLYGAPLWKKQISSSLGGNISISGKCKILPTGDGYVIMCQDVFPNPVFYEVCILKLDNAFNVVWSKIYTDYATQLGLVLKDMCLTPDGIIAVGYSMDEVFEATQTAGHIVKLDINTGNIVWSKRYANIHEEKFESVESIPNAGSYIVVGSSKISHNAPKQPFAMRINDLGNITWEHLFLEMGNMEGEAHSLAIPASGDYAYLGGYVKNGNTKDILWLTIDKKFGHVADAQTFGTEENNESIMDVQVEEFAPNDIKVSAVGTIANNNKKGMFYTELPIGVVCMNAWYAHVWEFNGKNEVMGYELLCNDGQYLCLGSGKVWTSQYLFSFDAILASFRVSGGELNCGETMDMPLLKNVYYEIAGVKEVDVPLYEEGAITIVSENTPEVEICGLPRISCHAFAEKMASNTQTSIALYPNPSHGKVSLHIPNATKINRTEIQLLDMKGQVILSEIQSLSAGNNEFEYDLTHLPKGMYAFHIKIGNEVSIQKLIVD